MPKTLLLADDSLTIQKVVGITFAGEDIELVTVDNGDDALVRAREVRPDLVLADVTMPGMNGYELCRAIQRDPDLAGTPVLLLTGTFETFDGGRARDVGASGHITKPFEAQALIAQVNALLGAPARGPARRSAPEPAMEEAASFGEPGAEEQEDDPSIMEMSAADISLEDLGQLGRDDFFGSRSDGEEARGPAPATSKPPRGTELDQAFSPLDPLEEDDDFGPLTPDRADAADAMAKTTLFRPQAVDTEASRPQEEPLAARSSRAEDLSSPDLPWVEPMEAEPVEEAASDLPEADPLFQEGPPVRPGRGPRAEEQSTVSGKRHRRSPDIPESLQLEAERLDADGDAEATGPAPWRKPTASSETRRERPHRGSEGVAEIPVQQLRESIEKIAWEAFGSLSEQVVREIVQRIEAIAWETIPTVAERLVRAEIARLKGDEPTE